MYVFECVLRLPRRWRRKGRRRRRRKRKRSSDIPLVSGRLSGWYSLTPLRASSIWISREINKQQKPRDRYSNPEHV
jgi:hypothetical protein